MRSDSAAYQADIINYCESEGIEFAIGADLDEAVLEAIRTISNEDWAPYKNGYIAETIHSMNKTKEAFRLIYKPQAYCDTQSLSGQSVCWKRDECKIYRDSYQQDGISRGCGKVVQSKR